MLKLNAYNKGPEIRHFNTNVIGKTNLVYMQCSLKSFMMLKTRNYDSDFYSVSVGHAN